MLLLVSLTRWLLLRHQGETGTPVKVSPMSTTAFNGVNVECEPSCCKPLLCFLFILYHVFAGLTSSSAFIFFSFLGPTTLSETTFSTSLQAALLHLAPWAHLVLRAQLHLQAPCGQLTFKLPLQARLHSTGPHWSPGSSCPQLESL